MTNQAFESNSGPRFIVFTGPSLSGKTTASQFMAIYMQSTGLVVYRDSFEAPMKQYLASLMAKKISLMPPDDIVSPLGKTPRDFMLREQQHMRFTYGPGILGQLLEKRAAQWKSNPQYIIVDDGTSINDVRALGDYLLVRIDRDTVERVYPFTIPAPKYVISNKGTLMDLHTLAVRLTKQIMGEAK